MMIDLCVLSRSVFGTLIALHRVDAVPDGRDTPPDFEPIGGWRTSGNVTVSDGPDGCQLVEWPEGRVYADAVQDNRDRRAGL